MSKVFLVGEQVTATSIEIKGFDYFGVNAYKEDGHVLFDALTQSGHTVTWMRTCHVAQDFPEKLEALQEYDVILLSDVGSNSLLFHPELLAKSIRHSNRLQLLKEYVARGGGLAMIGGWMSFAGIDGRARYHHTPVEEALPVTCQPYDDRMERPEGVIPTVMDPNHPILRGVPSNWPFFLGYNQVSPKPYTANLLQFGSDPLLCVWEYEKGRSAAFTSDCAPHWGPNDFLAWKGYPVFWNNMVRWLARNI